MMTISGMGGAPTMGRVRDLRLEDVVPILSRYPGIGAPTGIRRAPGGTANANYAVETTSGCYFLRRRNPRYAGEDAITYDHRLMEHLAGRGMAVALAREVDGMPGRRWLRLDAANVVELYPWRDGDAFDQHNHWHLVAAGDALGRFHAMTRRFVRLVGKEWGRYDNPSAIRDGVRHARRMKGAHGSLALLNYLEEQAVRIATELPDQTYDALPHTVIHGDYHPANVLFAGHRVAGIFDLDWATHQPRIRDLADGVLFFAARRASDIQGDDITSLTQSPWLDTHRTHLFLAAYMAAAQWPLTAEELTALPTVVRARWLACRIDGMRKVPPERRLSFLLADVDRPLRWLDERASDLVRTSACTTRVRNGTLP